MAARPMIVDVSEEVALQNPLADNNEIEVAEAEAGGAAIRAAQQAGEAAAVAAAAASRVSEASELKTFLEKGFTMLHGWGGEVLESWGR